MVWGYTVCVHISHTYTDTHAIKTTYTLHVLNSPCIVVYIHYTFTHVQVSVQVHSLVWVIEARARNWVLVHHSLSSYMRMVSLTELKAHCSIWGNWPVSSQDPPVSVLITIVVAHEAMAGLYVGSEDSNLRIHTCRATLFPTEPSLQSQVLCILIPIKWGQ